MNFLKSTCIVLVLSLAFLGCGSSTGPDDGDDETDPDPTEYSLAVTTNPDEGGSVDPESGTFEEGSEVTVEATANEGWEFSSWSGDAESEENPLTFTIEEDTDLTAAFSEVQDEPSQYDLTVSADPSEGGAVDPESGTYEEGSEVEIEATANEGWEFAGWTGDIESDENLLSVTIEEDTDLTAIFSEVEPAEYDLTVSTDPSEGGTVDPASGNYEEGTEVTIEATANEGYEFNSWTGDIDSEDNPLTVTITEDTDLTAVFDEATNEYSLEVSESPEDAGTINTSPFGTTHEEGTEITVEAEPDQGYELSEWTGDIQSEENPLSFVIEENTELTANFEELSRSYVVFLNVSDGRDTKRGLRIGQLREATDGYDASHDREAPPPPPEGSLHAYFEVGDLELFRDVRSSYDEQPEWTLHYQLGSGEEFELDWDMTEYASVNGSLTLTDESGSFEVDMLSESSHTVTGGTSGTLLIQYTPE